MNRKISLASLLSRGRLRGRRLGAHVLVATLVLGGLMLASPAALRADTYVYTGSQLGQDGSFAFSSGFTNINGSFTISGSLGANVSEFVTATSFSFSDGLDTISSANATSAEIYVVTNSVGAIIDWAVDLSDASGAMLSCWDVPQADPFPPTGASYCEPGTGFGGSGDEAFFGGYVGLVVPGSGAWVDVPEPSVTLLLACGLLIMIGMTLRRKQLA